MTAFMLPGATVDPAHHSVLMVFENLTQIRLISIDA